MKKWFRKSFAPRPSSGVRESLLVALWLVIFGIILMRGIRWSRLPPGYRYIGFKIDWYSVWYGDPICGFGLWWGHFYTDFWM